MIRRAAAIAALCLALSGAAALAHPNHDGPPISRDELPGLSQRVVALLVEAKQLAPSWQGKPAKDVASRQLPEGPVWMVTLENPDEADKAKRIVYMFFDEFGNFIGGNHSGRLQ